MDDRPEVTINPRQTGKSIRELFGFKDDVNLFRDYESPHDEPIGLEEAAPFDKGPVFYTRRQHTQLTIIVNNKRFTEAEGVNWGQRHRFASGSCSRTFWSAPVCFG